MNNSLKENVKNCQRNPHTNVGGNLSNADDTATNIFTSGKTSINSKSLSDVQATDSLPAVNGLT